MSVLFAATYPERVSKLILFGGYVQRRDLPDNWEELAEERARLWGTGAMIKTIAPKFATIPAAVEGFAKFERLSASPGAVRSFTILNWSTDVSSVLPTVRVPTLVLHRKDDIHVSIDLGRELAAQIPGAKMIEYSGSEHAFFTGDNFALLGDIEEFITGHRGSSSGSSGRFLATILFTDIVGSTRNAAVIGDQAWRRLLDAHDELASVMIKTHGGTLVRSTGDGVLATFDGPGRAVHCALAMRSASKQIGLPLRAGLHTGEIEIRGKDILGIAVHAASRVMAQSQPDEVLVSRVVTDLVAGAGLTFSERGSHQLKGLPGCWDLFAANHHV